MAHVSHLEDRCHNSIPLSQNDLGYRKSVEQHPFPQGLPFQIDTFLIGKDCLISGMLDNKFCIG